MKEFWLPLVAWALALIWIVKAWAVRRGIHEFEFPPIPDDEPPASGTAAESIGDACPAVSLIVPCRDEADHIHRALSTLLAIDYDRLEIIVVDDRSTDGTTEQLHALAATHRNLVVLRVDELPEGWLGKCHALHLGASRAAGEWLLFADADVSQDPLLLKRAVRFATRHRLKLLSLLPRNESPSLMMRTLMTVLYHVTIVTMGYWMRRRDGRQTFDGVAAGAFCLVDKTVYERAGGHAALRLAVVDDLSLGALIRRQGVRTELRFAGPVLSVPYAATLAELTRVSTKNAFAILRFSWVLLILVSALILAVHLAGPLLWWFAPSTLWPAGLIVWCSLGYCFQRTRGYANAPLWALAFHPVIPLIWIWLLWNSAIQTAWNGGVRWRDRVYSLRELRAWKSGQ